MNKPVAVLVIGLVASLSLACDRPAPATAPAPKVMPGAAAEAIAPRDSTSQLSVSGSATPATGLTQVTDISQVCMVTNQFMATPQIPIEVNGRTYYGCCEMCKARLGNDAAVRTAVDPVSGASVDKASAIIGKDASGKLTYFETTENLDAFRGGSPR